jgi:hypothetical protein
VCHTPNVPGKFNVQKATQLGVPKGPLFGIFLFFISQLILFLFSKAIKVYYNSHSFFFWK